MIKVTPKKNKTAIKLATKKQTSGTMKPIEKKVSKVASMSKPTTSRPTTSRPTRSKSEVIKAAIKAGFSETLFEYLKDYKSGWYRTYAGGYLAKLREAGFYL